MNAEVIIKEDALRFSRVTLGLQNDHNGDKQFKDKLITILYDYYEPIDKLIFLYEIDKIFDEKYQVHFQKCEYKDEPEKCRFNLFFIRCKFFIEQEIRALNPSFNYTILRPNINSDLLKQNLVSLVKFPESAKLFQSAIDKLNESRFERNLLDDMRLSLESLLKSKLNNSKSLEHQLDSIGDFLKVRGNSKELTNMFRTLVDYYSKYQNSYVKHNDKIKEDEVDLLVNLTSAFINFIIQN